MSGFSLNESQYRAVHHRGGPLLVLAGAGSGKTRVITERIAALIERDVPEDAITAVTFTNKAAREMRERLLARLGDTAKRLRICTFHALGLMMVREHAELVDRSAQLTVYGPGEQKSALRTVLADMGLPADATQIDRLLRQVSSLKNGLLADDQAERIEPFRERYDALLQRMNAVDFDDLMVLPIRLLRENGDVRALWRMRTRHFLVDEYQDSSRTQYELVRLLVPADGNLTVVGDDDQSIYGWRGAEVRNLFQLEHDYPSLTVIRLEENYRSTGAILKASNSLIANNSERLGKTLRSNLGPGKPVRIWECTTPEEEAARVATDIRAKRAAGARWEDFCVLYRASHQSRQVEMALRDADIPYHVSGGLSFFDRSEIQSVLAYLRLVHNPADDLAFMRAIAKPRRGIGDKALGALAEFAGSQRCSLFDACMHPELRHKRADTLRAFGEMMAMIDHRFCHGEPDDAFDALLHDTGLEQAIREDCSDEQEEERRMANVLELRRWWLRHCEGGGGLKEFLQHVFLVSDRAEEEEPVGNVRLMTVHAAKGLEFDHVYVIGMEDGTFPHKNAVLEQRLEEERRLMYVAMTRARFRLTLSYAKQRRRYGKMEKNAPSPFLDEIEPSAVRWVDRDPGSEEAQEEIEAHMANMRRLLGLAG